MYIDELEILTSWEDTHNARTPCTLCNGHEIVASIFYFSMLCAVMMPYEQAGWTSSALLSRAVLLDMRLEQMILQEMKLKECKLEFVVMMMCQKT